MARLHLLPVVSLQIKRAVIIHSFPVNTLDTLFFPIPEYEYAEKSYATLYLISKKRPQLIRGHASRWLFTFSY